MAPGIQQTGIMAFVNRYPWRDEQHDPEITAAVVILLESDGIELADDDVLRILYLVEVNDDRMIEALCETKLYMGGSAQERNQS